MTKETNKGCLLYVEDDPALSYITKDNLEELGYKVIHFDNGQAALSNFSAYNFNLCLLDVMLPKMDGFDLARRIRELNDEIPILFLSAKSGTDDRIEGLALGGDDYLTKPFSIEELRLKIEVFLKRNKILVKHTKSNELLTVGKYVLDVSNQQLRVDQESLKLTLRETKLMELFFVNVNNIISRQEILLKIWGDDSYFNGRSLDVFISRIRKYLKKDSNLEVESIRSIGFRLTKHML
jgi:DNA-binding response OmpR family regulator